MTPIGFIFYLLTSILNLLLPLEGFIKMHRTKKDHLLRGGFIFYNALNLSSWLIYGFISNNLIYSYPLFLGTAVFYVFVSLVFFQEYANIVYHGVIIINYSWWVRQQKIELIYQMSVFTAGLFLIIPHLGSLYYCFRYKDKQYISFMQLVGHAFSAIFYLVFCVLEGFAVLGLLNILKLVVLGLQVFLYRKLEEKAKKEEILKKKE